MKAYSGSTSEGFLPAQPGATPATATAPAPEDPSAKFNDFLQQHAGSSAAKPSGAPATTDTQAGTPSTTTASTNDALTFFMAGQNARPTLPTAPTPDAGDAATSDADPADTQMPAGEAGGLPLLSLAHYSWLNQSGASDPTATAMAGAASSPNATATGLPHSPLSLLLAQATSLAASARPQTAPASSDANATAAASSLALNQAGYYPTAPLFQGLAKPAATPGSTEKKSPAISSERSFIQGSGQAATTTDASALMLASAASLQAQGSGYQPIATSKTLDEKGANGASSGLSAAAGTTNGKKEVDMNATLEMPDLVVSSGTNPLVTKTSADVHILLGTNNDFNEAIDQVMHVAELSNLSLTSNPLRVAIEIQTPPGAIVNVYVSRQADSSYRAQLSTNDVQALGWVQDQIGSLKGSTNTGTDIRWAPAQLETGTTATASSSSSNGGNLDWNRGGNQGGNESSDERPSRNRTIPATDEDDAELGIPFLETLGAIGSVA